MSSSNRKFPVKDPYEVLGLVFGAADSEISTSYRKLARTLHPDKLVAQNLPEAELAQAAIRFQEIQTARSFLLDVEHAESRRKYDAQQASNRMRRAADRAREEGMSHARKRMRDELKLHEEQAANSNRRKQQVTSSPSATVTKDELARQGRELREQYAAQAAAADLRERNQAAIRLQERQIRLKWSRKKLKASGHSSPSEDSIAKMLSQSCGGNVEEVQMIGAKGNVALVSFRDEACCNKAVDTYSTSDIWRASFVSKGKLRKQEEVAAQPQKSSTFEHRDREDVHEWKARQAAEREALLRRMEHDEDDATYHRQSNGEPSSAQPFPPPFPNEYAILSLALDKLEKAEDTLLQGIVSEQSKQRMKIVR